MPSVQPIPTLRDCLRAFGDAVHGYKDERANTRSGSGYDSLAGTAAILFTREAQRDRDLFRACYFDTAEGDDLTAMGLQRFGFTRGVDTYGTGTVYLARATSAAGAGTIWAGTRFGTYGFASQNATRIYACLQDTPVGPFDVVSAVPIRYTQLGEGAALRIDTASGPRMRIDDPLWDSSWTVQALTCADGTTFEQAAEYRARIRQARIDSRKGYARYITNQLLAAGAANVALFASNFAGAAYDFGLNMVYVGDASYQFSTALYNACMVALDSAAVAGTGVQVRGMQTQNVPVTAVLTLNDDPGLFNTSNVAAAALAALQAYFDGRANAYGYRLDAMAGAIAQASSAIQNVSFVTPTTDAVVMPVVAGVPSFQGTITRYLLDPTHVTFTFAAPS